MDGMYPLMGLVLAKEIHRDRLVAAEQRRAARRARKPLATRVSQRARTWRPPTVVQVGRARATAPSAPMGCTA